jgi:hypothetical protein
MGEKYFYFRGKVGYLRLVRLLFGKTENSIPLPGLDDPVGGIGSFLVLHYLPCQTGGI